MRFDYLKRREFITLLAGVAVGGPLAAHAQQPAQRPTIGFLGVSTPLAARDLVAAFLQRLHELGWNEDRNIAIEYWWAEERAERFAEIANEVVRLKVDVIVTYGSALTVAAKQATSVIPIVFPVATDPVGTGLVTSLGRPGGNVTTLSAKLRHGLRAADAPNERRCG